MIKKLNNKPEDILLVSGIKEIGNAVNLNRERTAVTILGISKESNSMYSQMFSELTDDGEITDAEKPALKRELESITRDFQIMRRDARENGVGDSDEYRAYEESYDKLYDLLNKIINSVGTYGAPDVNYINPYYTEYHDNATILGNLIINIKSNNAIIDTYYARTKVIVDIFPDSVPVNTSTTISAKIMYDGESVDMDDVPSSAIAFGLVGLATGIQQSAFGLPAGATVDITEITHSAVVRNCKTFTFACSGIGSDGVSVTCNVTLDSDSMPF